MVIIGLITITNLRPVAFNCKYLEKFRVIFNVYFSFRLDDFVVYFWLKLNYSFFGQQIELERSAHV